MTCMVLHDTPINGYRVGLGGVVPRPPPEVNRSGSFFVSRSHLSSRTGGLRQLEKPRQDTVKHRSNVVDFHNHKYSKTSIKSSDDYFNELQRSFLPY